MSFDLKLESGSIVIANGDLVKVTNNDKLVQDIIKIVVTPVGSNTTHPWYGSALQDRVTGTAYPRDVLDQEVVASVAHAVKNLKSLQEQQSRAGQFVSPGEQIAKLIGVNVIRSVQDPRKMDIVISILTKSGIVLEEQVEVRL